MGTHDRVLQIIPCALIVAVLACYFYLRSAHDLFASEPGLDQAGQLQWGQTLNRRLHPEEHIYRNATTQSLTWHVSSDFRAPDGVRKRVYLVNGEFVSPTVEARPGDTLEITVENGLEEGTSLHWHGLHLRGANEMDGALGLTQCAIPPGGNYSYIFKLDQFQHGTFWWHAHDQTERADGLYGGLVIHKPMATEVTALDQNRFSYDEEQLLLIGDWYHRPASEVMAWYMRAGSFGNEPVPDSVIVNGVGAYNCSDAGLARPVECSPTDISQRPSLILDQTKSYRFRVVNVGSLAGFTISVPGARLTAITLDGGHEIEAELANSIGVLHPGERVDIIISWAGLATSESHSDLQIELDEEAFRYPNPALTLLHSFPIHDSNLLQVSQNAVPRLQVPTTTKASELFLLNAANASRSSGRFMLREAHETILLYATTKKLAKLHNNPFGFFNQTSWKPQKIPSLPLLGLDRSDWDENQFVPFISSSLESPSVIDLVINNIDDGSHPFHLHGHDAYVLSNCADGSYWGSYNPFRDPNPPCGAYNLENPILRDTVTVPRRGYVVLRFLADNPGIWMLHCHLLWHQAAGMAMGLHVGEENDSETSVISGWTRERARKVSDICSVSG